MNSIDGPEAAHGRTTAMPAKPYSVIGVSMTRCGPNSSSRPWRDLVGALILGDFLAHHGRRPVVARASPQPSPSRKRFAHAW